MSSHPKLSAFATSAALALFATFPLFASVSTDYDHRVNFRSYRTFSFYKVQTPDPLDQRRIKEEVAQDLTKAGWQQVPSGGDISITAIGGVHDKQEYNTFYDGLGMGGFGWGGWGGWGGGWGGGGDSQTTVETVPVGTLMVDMYDASTHQLVWRGRSQEDLSNKSEKNTHKLEKDIDHMLNGFPPKAKD